jgi:hypothetical protein
LFKWSKVESTWGNGPWLVNEQGNTGTKPSDANTKAFFALTMLTANSEFFGVDVPNVAISSPHDGGNAWTAVEMKIVDTGVANPDFTGEISKPDEILPIDHDYDLGSGYESSYDGTTHTITFEGAWKGRGWWFGSSPGKDISDYKYAVVEFEPVAFQVQLVAEYNGGIPDNKQLVNAGADVVVLELNPEGAGDVKQLYLQTSVAGQLVLRKAYLTNTDPRKPDLIVTDITWEPANPKPGDAVTFSATIQNIGEGATPNVKHGVAFSIGTSVVTWSDNHKTGLASGESVVITATGGPTGAATWTAGRNQEYTVIAHVNDNPSDGIKNESNADNNTFEKTLIIDGKADLIITSLAWKPTSPKVGDDVVFNVVVKNQGEVNTPAGVINGVAFYVNDEVVSWSDDNTVSLTVNSQVRLTANGGPNSGDGSWKVTRSGEYMIKAHVNDQKRYDELDFDNNIYTSETKIIITVIDNVSTGGSVYVVNGKIQLAGYSETASVAIYNLLGQQIARDTNVVLSVGTYLVRVQDSNGKPVTHKVLVK